MQVAEADAALHRGLVSGRPTSASSLQVKTHPHVAAVSCITALLAAYMSCEQQLRDVLMTATFESSTGPLTYNYKNRVAS